MDVEKFEENIGKKCRKRPLDDKNIGKYKLKPFKSGLKVNTIAGVINHPKLEGRMAYTFEEDESYVECRRCEVIKPRFDIKTKEEVLAARPTKPEGFWWRDFLSNCIFFSAMFSPFYLISLIMLLLGMFSPAGNFIMINVVITILLSLIMIDSMGPNFTSKILKTHFYKKRKMIWNKWWSKTARHISYLEYKKTLEEHEG